MMLQLQVCLYHLGPKILQTTKQGYSGVHDGTSRNNIRMLTHCHRATRLGGENNKETEEDMAMKRLHSPKCLFPIPTTTLPISILAYTRASLVLVYTTTHLYKNYIAHRWKVYYNHKMKYNKNN